MLSEDPALPNRPLDAGDDEPELQAPESLFGLSERAADSAQFRASQ
jgi:hypothetical protein